MAQASARLLGIAVALILLCATVSCERPREATSKLLAAKSFGKHSSPKPSRSGVHAMRPDDTIVGVASEGNQHARSVTEKQDLAKHPELVPVKATSFEKTPVMQMDDANSGANMKADLMTKVESTNVEEALHTREADLVTKAKPANSEDTSALQTREADLVTKAKPANSEDASALQTHEADLVTKSEPTVSEDTSVLQTHKADLVTKVEPTVSEDTPVLQTHKADLVTKVEPTVSEDTSALQTHEADLVTRAERGNSEDTSALQTHAADLATKVEPTASENTSVLQTHEAVFVTRVEPTKSADTSVLQTHPADLATKVEQTVSEDTSVLETHAATLVTKVKSTNSEDTSVLQTHEAPANDLQLEPMEAKNTEEASALETHKELPKFQPTGLAAMDMEAVRTREESDMEVAGTGEDPDDETQLGEEDAVLFSNVETQREEELKALKNKSIKFSRAMRKVAEEFPHRLRQRIRWGTFDDEKAVASWAEKVKAKVYKHTNKCVECCIATIYVAKNFADGLRNVLNPFMLSAGPVVSALRKQVGQDESDGALCLEKMTAFADFWLEAWEFDPVYSHRQKAWANALETKLAPLWTTYDWCRQIGTQYHCRKCRTSLEEYVRNLRRNPDKCLETVIGTEPAMRT